MWVNSSMVYWVCRWWASLEKSWQISRSTSAFYIETVKWCARFEMNSKNNSKTTRSRRRNNVSNVNNESGNILKFSCWVQVYAAVVQSIDVHHQPVVDTMVQVYFFLFWIRRMTKCLASCYAGSTVWPLGVDTHHRTVYRLWVGIPPYLKILLTK